MWSNCLKSYNAFRLLPFRFGISEQFLFNNAAAMCCREVMVELLAVA
jgi:hypothetical protein